MELPPRTKVRRPDLADTVGGDRIGWVAPPGRYPTRTDFNTEDPDGPPAIPETAPPDDSGLWVVVWWSNGYRDADGTPSGFYQWEYVPWLEVLEVPE